MRRLGERRIPRVVAVAGVFAALLVPIIPAVGQVQALTERGTRLLDRARDLPYVGEQVATIDQAPLVELAQSNGPSAGQVLNGAFGSVGGIFGAFGTILNLLLMLIIYIYVLLDRERIASAALYTVPGTVRVQTAELFRTVESALVEYLLVPRMVGSSFGVHPLWVLFATLAATALYGDVFAVPIVVVIVAAFR